MKDSNGMRIPKRAYHKSNSKSFSVEDYYKTFQSFKTTKPGNISEKQFNALHRRINELIIQKLIDGEIVKFGNLCRMQFFQSNPDVVIYNPRLKKIQHTHLHNPILTKMLWEKDPEAKRNGVRVYNGVHVLPVCKYRNSSITRFMRFEFQDRIKRRISQDIRDGKLEYLTIKRTNKRINKWLQRNDRNV